MEVSLAMEVPPNHHPFLDGISPYKPTILGGPTIDGNPHIAP